MEKAPNSIKDQKFESFFGRKIAIDASMSIYQFLVHTHLHSPKPPPMIIIFLFLFEEDIFYNVVYFIL